MGIGNSFGFWRAARTNSFIVQKAGANWLGDWHPQQELHLYYTYK